MSTNSHNTIDIQRPFMVNDEIARLSSKNEVQFGKILEEYPAYHTFLVDWRTPSGDQIEVENGFNPSDEPTTKLVDRCHSDGERVVHMPKRLVGEIVDSFLLASIYLPGSGSIIENVPIDSLLSWTMFTGELLVLNGWIGKVSSVEYLCNLQYDDGNHCNMQMTHMIRSSMSFGYYKYSKVTSPYKGQRVKPTETEYATVQWLGNSLLDNLHNLIFSHRGLEATVVSAKMCKLYVKWLYPLYYGKQEPSPPRELDTPSVLEAVDFDIKFKNWFKQHTICHYKVSTDDEPFSATTIHDLFIQEFLQHQPEPLNKRHKSDPEEQQKWVIPKAGEVVYAEVMRTRHVYRVKWDGVEGIEESVPGSELSPWHINEIPTHHNPLSLDSHWVYWEIYDREIVQTKVHLLILGSKIALHHENPYGVTQHRNLSNDIVVVDFFEENNKYEVIFLERLEISKYDLLPHKTLGGLKPGAVVTCCSKSELIVGPQNVGMVIRVNRLGLIEAHFGQHEAKNHRMLFNPSQLMVHPIPEDLSFKEPVVNTEVEDAFEIRDKFVTFMEEVSKDLREVLDNEHESIKVKFLERTQRQDLYTVLMFGPEGTPYEGGVFIFQLQLPLDYPNNVPTLTMLRHPLGAFERTCPIAYAVPIGNEFLSYSISPEGQVLHPWLGNAVPADLKKEELGWEPQLSILDLLSKIQRDIFPKEPLYSKPSLKFKQSKECLPALDKKIWADITALNASIVINTFDMLRVMYYNPPEQWQAEIKKHYEKVAPVIKLKFDKWIASPLSASGDLSECPKYHMYPMSRGFVEAIERRTILLETDIRDHESGDQ